MPAPALEDMGAAMTSTPLLAARLARGIRRAALDLHRRGAVVAVSGGVDSGVVAALCVEALGASHVLLLRLPERDLGERSSDLGEQLADRLGAPSVEVPISDALAALGCYAEQERALRQVLPEYETGWPYKVVRSDSNADVIVFFLVVERPDGSQVRCRIPSGPYRTLLAATNMKQRVRTLLQYTWADRHHYLVAGTPNLLEYDQGFFVKGGDGLADVKPIAGLYKQQVYALARHFQLPEGIASRAPTTETFTLAQSQDEFYFGYPHGLMDLFVWGERTGIPAAELAVRAGVDVVVVEAAYREVASRRKATRYLHAPAVVLDPGPDPHSGRL